MTNFYEGVNKVVAGTAETLASLDSIYVAANVTVGSSQAAVGVQAAGAARVNIVGAIISVGGTGFDSSGGGNRITIGQSGTVSGGVTAMDIHGGGNHIANAGTIMGEAALDLGDNGNQIINSGQIIASFLTCINLSGGDNFVVNSGVIDSADGTAIQIDSESDDEQNFIDNSGTISAGDGYVALIADNAVCAVTNSGHIFGDVDLGDSADSYDGGQGNIVGVVNAGGGDDKLIGGGSSDHFNGGAGADRMEGGGGHDVFIYDIASQSNGQVHDRITDFDGRKDAFDLGVAVTHIDATVNTGQLRAAHFGSDLQTALAGLGVHHAGLFKPDAGNLRGHTILVVDRDGVAGFSSSADFAFDITDATNLPRLDVDNFI